MALTHACSTSKPANQSTHLETNAQYWILWCYILTCPFVLQRNSFGKVRQQHDGTETCVWWIHYSNMDTRTGRRNKRKVGLYVTGRGFGAGIRLFTESCFKSFWRPAWKQLLQLSAPGEKNTCLICLFRHVRDSESNADQWEPLSSRWTRISVIINQK